MCASRLVDAVAFAEGNLFRVAGVGQNMTARTAHRLVRLVAPAAVAVAALAGLSGSASAGGWAVGSLDSVPAATPGETTDVGFTILQHGVSPVELDDDVGIEIRDHDGVNAFFPARRDDTPGHYVATVTFPEAAGSYAWSIRMGGFGPHELGTLDVRSPEPDSVVSWPTIRWLVLGGSVLLAGIAIADFTVSHRRRRVALR